MDLERISGDGANILSGLAVESLGIAKEKCQNSVRVEKRNKNLR